MILLKFLGVLAILFIIYISVWIKEKCMEDWRGSRSTPESEKYSRKIIEDYGKKKNDPNNPTN